jgi:hypothetical protein
MTDQDPTLQDVWRLLGSMNRRINERLDGMNRRINERLDALERQIVATDAGVSAKMGALKESIEARDFRLDDHGRRLSKLEESQP